MASASSSSSSPRLLEEEGPVAGRDEHDLMSPPPDMVNNNPPLPLDMLDIIFSRLPFEQLILTSRLSRDWHRRWESFPNLDIWFSPGIFPKPDVGTLERCAAPVRSFTAHVGTPHHNRIAGWLHALARKRLEMLILRFDGFPFERAVLGPGLFSCRALARLELHGFRLMARAPPQGFGGFPNHATLVLIDVTLPFVGDGAQLERLISSAPQLSVLTLDNVITAVEETWTIRAPNLRVLKFSTDFDNGCRLTEELPLLEEAFVTIDDPIEFGTQNVIDFLRRIASVKRLSFDTDTIHSDFMEQQFMLNENFLEGIPFPNLRVADLRINFGELPSIMSIFSLMRTAPHIEILDIKAEKITIRRRKDGVDEDFVCKPRGSPKSDDEIDQDVLNAEISDDLFANLKHVSLNDMTYCSNDIWFMKFLLSKAGLLESFSVTFGYRNKTISFEKICRELVTCRKASPQVKLSLRVRSQPGPSMMDSLLPNL